jgi:23S rRNA (uracil1939-C5)-methyltransferase
MEPTPVELFIEHFCPRGFGVAQSDRAQIEVAHAIPGDRVTVDLRRRSRRVQKGRLLEILQPSHDRVEARCPHASLCGGCCWQVMNYSAQIKHKQDFVRRSFGSLLDPTVNVRTFIPCEDPWHYRNKMEFSFSENRAGTKYLGLMIAHAEPYVFNLESCYIAPTWMADCLSRVRSWWVESGLSAYYPPKDSGSLRYLTLRESVRTKQRLAILNVSGNSAFAPPQEQINRFVQAVGENIGIFLRIHQICKGVPSQFFEMHLAGPDHIVEQMQLTHGPLHFKISPSSFFQPNTIQAEKLYNTAVSMLGTDHPLVYDLYCGTGTLGMAAAPVSRQVVGIDLSPESILDAEENAKRNNLSNIRFYQGDVGRVLTNLLASGDFVRPDAVIVDPPRAGLDALTLHHLKVLHPKKIVYVSCNPATQAENIQELVNAGYSISCMQAVDQFPHTAHIENIALLVRSGIEK